jgi:ABC-2 type transport system permease protein
MADTPGGVIYDIGYQRYGGERLGRLHARRALYFHSLAGTFGIGRGAKAKIVPFAIMAIISGSVLLMVSLASRTGKIPMRYDSLPWSFQLLIAIFVAAQAAETLCRDQRFGVLPLYFSRPIRRDDYSIAKLGAMTSALFILMGGPLLLLYIGSLFTVTHKPADVRTETGQFLLGLTHAAVCALILAALGLAVASFAKRRAFATGAVIGVYIVSSAVAHILASLPGGAMTHATIVAPFDLLEGFKAWALHGRAQTEIGTVTPIYGVAAVVMFTGCLLVLVARYRKVRV